MLKVLVFPLKVSAVTCGAVLSTLAAVPAQAAILGGETLSDSVGIADIFRKPKFSAEIVQYNQAGLVRSRTPIFSQTLLPSDVGKPFTVNPDNTPNFDSIEALLTNGEEEDILLGLSGKFGLGSFVGNRESVFTNTGATDFQGFFINELTFSVDSFDADIPGSDPNNDGIWTDYKAQYSFKVAGEPVPEPSSAMGTLVLAGVGAVIAGRRVIRSKKSKNLRTITLTPVGRQKR